MVNATATNTENDRQLADGAGVFSGSQSAAPVDHSPENDNESATPKNEVGAKTSSWSDLPRKKQLFVIAWARLSEPLVQTSLQAYLFYQLKWFDPSLPDSTISAQAGVLHASFMFAQFITGMFWGRVADSQYFGRKTVILVGLIGTSLSCLGFGLSKTFYQALIFRTLGGATNGNVGVMRTMISEIIREKKYQSRAFLILPMTFNIGIIIGPVLGGILSDPAGNYPNLFGNIAFLKEYPYATPNIVSSIFLLCAAISIWLGLEETLDSIVDTGHQDLGTRLGEKLYAMIKGRSYGYIALPTSEDEVDLSNEVDDATAPPVRKSARRFTQRLPFRRMFTKNVLFTLFAQFLMTLHVGTFGSIWFIFLSTPVHDPASSDHPTRFPFLFTGGLGLQPRYVGLAMSIIGIIGILMQVLLYPTASARLGTIRSWRYFLVCFPIAYFLVPYLAVVPSATPPPEPKTGVLLWASFVVVLMIYVLGRTFALPAQVILINNCSPHPSVLGTIHGLGQSVSCGARSLGPVIGGFMYGLGLNNGVVGLAWWGLSAVGVCACLASLLVREGNGHEIWLEGDEEEEE